MLSSTFGDMAQQQALRRHAESAKKDNLRFSRELMTGLVADSAKRLGGDFSELASVHHRLALATAQADIARSAGLFLSLQQTTLDALRANVDSSLSDMILLNAGSSQSDILRALSLAEGQFHETISRLNTDFAGRPLFGGASATLPVVAGSTGLLETLISDITVALPPDPDFAALSGFVDDWFAETGPFDSVGYLGGPSVAARLDLGEGQTVGMDVTAQDTALRQTLAMFAKGAILSRGVFTFAPTALRDAVTQLSGGLRAASAQLVALSGQIGIEEAKASKGIARAEATIYAMQTAQVDMLKADPYETATRLEKTMSQLELVFTLTSRLSRLTLAGFLR